MTHVTKIYVHLFWALVELGNSPYNVCVGGWNRGGKHGGQNAIVLGPILLEVGEWPLPFLSCIHEKALCRQRSRLSCCCL